MANVIKAAFKECAGGAVIELMEGCFAKSPLGSFYQGICGQVLQPNAWKWVRKMTAVPGEHAAEKVAQDI